MSERFDRFWVITLVLGLHGAALGQFLLQFARLATPAEWSGQFQLLLFFSCALSVFLLLTRKNFTLWVLLFVKSIILYVVGLPLGGYLGVQMTLFTAFVIEIIYYTPFQISLPAIGGLMAVNLFLQRQHIIAWGRVLPQASWHDVLSFGVYVSVIVLLNVLVRLQRINQTPNKEINQRLEESTLQLVQANMLLQEYAVMAEQMGITNERKRLAREMHDTLAHNLTNILMMLEAAHVLANEDKTELRDYLQRARDQAKAGLDDIRFIIQALRPEQLEMATGLGAVRALVDAFANATAVEVKLNPGDAPEDFGEEADWAVYRLVQEGITNALRHGKASQITISLSRIWDGLSILVMDNGVGAYGLKEGFGIIGMRERFERLGGKLEVTSKPGEGFKILAWLPLKF